ncbi:MAG: hypothetical protein KF878_08965 [Planctomycetes bacterium]|nr:hypothetical protein [Planctomycetota bacterium]
MRLVEVHPGGRGVGGGSERARRVAEVQARPAREVERRGELGGAVARRLEGAQGVVQAAAPREVAPLLDERARGLGDALEAHGVLGARLAVGDRERRGVGDEADRRRQRAGGGPGDLAQGGRLGPREPARGQAAGDRQTGQPGLAAGAAHEHLDRAGPADGVAQDLALALGARQEEARAQALDAPLPLERGLDAQAVGAAVVCAGDLDLAVAPHDEQARAGAAHLDEQARRRAREADERRRVERGGREVDAHPLDPGAAHARQGHLRRPDAQGAVDHGHVPDAVRREVRRDPLAVEAPLDHGLAPLRGLDPRRAEGAGVATQAADEVVVLQQAAVELARPGVRARGDLEAAPREGEAHELALRLGVVGGRRPRARLDRERGRRLVPAVRFRRPRRGRAEAARVAARSVASPTPGVARRREPRCARALALATAARRFAQPRQVAYPLARRGAAPGRPAGHDARHVDARPVDLGLAVGLEHVVELQRLEGLGLDAQHDLVVRLRPERRHGAGPPHVDERVAHVHVAAGLQVAHPGLERRGPPAGGRRQGRLDPLLLRHEAPVEPDRPRPVLGPAVDPREGRRLALEQGDRVAEAPLLGQRVGRVQGPADRVVLRRRRGGRRDDGEEQRACGAEGG